jgi:hypothetical protein
MARTVRQTRAHPVKVLGDRQRRGDLHRLLRATEQDIAQAYVAGAANARHIAVQFAAAYALELQRLNADREEDEPQRKVPLTWLRSSGWGGRVTRGIAGAAHEAAEASRRASAQGVILASVQGHDDARALLVCAMRPAVRAGMDWTPKEPKPARRHR